MLWHICGTFLILSDRNKTKNKNQWLNMMHIYNFFYLCCCDTMSCNFSQTCKEKQFHYQKDENIVNKKCFHDIL